jgi:hypothetical protein
MVEGFITKKDKLEFRTIVLGQVKNVLDMSLQPAQNIRLKTETLNSGVLFLSDVLAPFYDEEMEKKYEEYENGVKYLNAHMKVIEGQYEVYRFDYGGLKKITRRLFSALNLLMNRIDYLKSSIYGDGESDDDVIEDEEDVE